MREREIERDHEPHVEWRRVDDDNDTGERETLHLERIDGKQGRGERPGHVTRCTGAWTTLEELTALDCGPQNGQLDTRF